MGNVVTLGEKGGAEKGPGSRTSKMQLRKIVDILAGNSLFSAKKGGETMQAYCMKCRTKKEMKDPKVITMKNGRPATQGICPTCGTKVFRIGKS